MLLPTARRLAAVAVLLSVALAIGSGVPARWVPPSWVGVANAVPPAPAGRVWAATPTVTSPLPPPGVVGNPVQDLYWVRFANGQVAPLWRVTGNIFVEPFVGLPELLKAGTPLSTDAAAAQAYATETMAMTRDTYDRSLSFRANIESIATAAPLPNSDGSYGEPMAGRIVTTVDGAQLHVSEILTPSAAHNPQETGLSWNLDESSPLFPAGEGEISVMEWNPRDAFVRTYVAPYTDEAVLTPQALLGHEQVHVRNRVFGEELTQGNVVVPFKVLRVRRSTTRQSARRSTRPAMTTARGLSIFWRRRLPTVERIPSRPRIGLGFSCMTW
jgi:hypothetical protein